MPESVINAPAANVKPGVVNVNCVRVPPELVAAAEIAVVEAVETPVALNVATVFE